jgi:hypothetical protein
MMLIRSKNRVLCGIVAMMVAFLSAASFSSAQGSRYAAKGSFYRDKETSYDIFASYLTQERGLSHVFDTNLGGGSMGGGLGVNHFFSRTTGIGSDINIPNNGGSFVDSATLNLLMRWPVGKSGLAPYLSAGGGRGYQPPWQWLGQVGAGLEFRTDAKGGLFVDARYIWGQKEPKDNLLLRAGLRLVF